jgi:hypothetical protein
MSEFTLGRFGDRRLEKGGPFCTPALLRRVAEDFVFGGWAAIVRERFV